MVRMIFNVLNIMTTVTYNHQRVSPSKMKQRSMLMFEQAIKSEATKKAYKYHLNNYKKWANIETFDGLLQAPLKDIQVLLEDYVMYLKSTVSPNSIPIYFAPIELFYVMNDINLNFKRIRKLFPEKVKKGNAKGYTHEDVQSILNFSKTKRHRALILLLSSSGVRIGAITDMKLKHLTQIEQSYAIKIYEGQKEEDFVFTTPESTKTIDDYLDERRKDGEYIDDESPLFRAEYQLGIEKVKGCSTQSLTQIMERLVTLLPRKRVGKTKRFEVAKNHGFRKMFATIIKSTTGINPTMTEKLINHIGVVRLDSSYFAPSMQEMFDSYKLAIPRLTINSQERQKIELADKNNRIDELEQERETSHHLKRNSEQQKEELVTIKNTVFTEAYFFNERLEEQKRFNESMMEKMIEMAKEIRELKSH
jgi:integrase